MSLDPFGGLMGGAIFGDVIFGDINGINRRPGRPGRGIGGSGIPDDYFAIVAANAAQAERERRRLERELEEVAVLIEAGLL